MSHPENPGQDSRLQDVVFEKPDLLDLTGRVIVVTGAGSGFGRTTAILAARYGATVVASDIDERRVTQTVHDLAAAGLTGTMTVGDVSVRADVEDMVAEALKVGGRIDGMCNIAGISPPAVSFLEFDDETFDRAMAVNARGVAVGTQVAARAMVERGSGSIVNFASATIDRATWGLVAYAASKSAVAQITRTAAAELAAKGVRVNAVAPGWVETPMAADPYLRADGTVDEARRDELLAGYAAQVPLGVKGRRLDVAAAVLFLLSDASGFITGQTLRVNGGMSMV